MTSAPAVEPDEAAWCAQRRVQVAEYLSRTGIVRGQIAEAPAWFVFPYVSLWAIESVAAPGYVGWWVICGDCPTDYVPCSGDRTPRSAIREISQRWADAGATMKRAEAPDGFSVGDSADSQELQPLLATRAAILNTWVNDPSLWVSGKGTLQGNSDSSSAS